MFSWPVAADVLVVEDDPDDLELTLRALRRHDGTLAIRAVHDGDEAIATLFGGAGKQPVSPMPRVVLLDLHLPRMSGLAILKRMRSEAATRRIPVVMLTASQDGTDIQACFEAGANGYIVKPDIFEHLVEAIGAVARLWRESAVSSDAAPDTSDGE